MYEASLSYSDVGLGIMYVGYVEMQIVDFRFITFGLWMSDLETMDV